MSSLAASSTGTSQTPRAWTSPFLDEWGKPLNYSRRKKLWAPAAKTAGLNGSAHSLRHFFASALIAGGASVMQVHAVLGHADPTITLRTYACLWPRVT